MVIAEHDIPVSVEIISLVYTIAALTWSPWRSW